MQIQKDQWDGTFNLYTFVITFRLYYLNVVNKVQEKITTHTYTHNIQSTHRHSLTGTIVKERGRGKLRKHYIVILKNKTNKLIEILR